MTYKVTTAEGMVLYVDGVDLDLIRAYLILQGSPPVTVEMTETQPPVEVGPVRAA